MVRHQIFSKDKGVIVADRVEMESAPSSIAILVLQTHRLLFVKEVSGAPSMHQFGSTFKHFLKNAVTSYWQSKIESSKVLGQRLTKSTVKERFPLPSVEVIPIVAKDTLKSFIDRFKVLKTLDIKLATTNNEADTRRFFKMLRENKNRVGSNQTSIRHHNSTGLDKEGCLQSLEGADQGNMLVELSGKDENGDEIKGNNDQFSVKAALGSAGKARESIEDQAYQRYRDLVKKGVVTEGIQHDAAVELRKKYERIVKYQKSK